MKDESTRTLRQRIVVQIIKFLWSQVCQFVSVALCHDLLHRVLRRYLLEVNAD